jgi:hypothetical protein
MFTFPPPLQQIAFAHALREARVHCLQEALGAAVETTDIAELDHQLSLYAPKPALTALAVQGLRGELALATPILLRTYPRLLMYYRLLLGYSQKEFYTTATGASRFKSMETAGKLGATADAQLETLCLALNQAAAVLLTGLSNQGISRSLLDDLTLLTLGPQLRGGANVRRGGDATQRVFDLIARVVRVASTAASARRIEFRNAAGRNVLIEFAADPDLIIREIMGKGGVRNVIALEIKGGTDFSNIHNRLGEAEKSHQKARANGYTECWTIINVERFDAAMARRESPSTDRFYRLALLEDAGSAEFHDFRERIVSLTGIQDQEQA